MGQGHSSSEWLQLLHNTTVHDVMKERERAGPDAPPQRPDHLVQLKSTDTLGTALQVFKEHRLQAAPVWSDSAKGDMGFFDLRDAISIIAKGAPRHGTWKLPAQALEQPIAHMISAHVANVPSNAVDFSRKDDVLEIGLNTTLKKVMDTMVKTSSHRLAVLDADRTRVVDVFTQSDALGWICRHANEPHVKEISERTLKELGLAHKKEMHYVTVNDNTMWAYSLIAEYHISAVPVVDEAGQIVGALSGVQLRGFTPADTDALCLPVGKFLESRKHRALNYCIPSTKLNAALAMMNNQGLHRLFVVNVHGSLRAFAFSVQLLAVPDTLHPISVVTLTDVVRTLLK